MPSTVVPIAFSSISTFSSNQSKLSAFFFSSSIAMMNNSLRLSLLISSSRIPNVSSTLVLSVTLVRICTAIFWIEKSASLAYFWIVRS